MSGPCEKRRAKITMKMFSKSNFSLWTFVMVISGLLAHVSSRYGLKRIKIKELYLAGRKIIIGNGRDTDFWRDPWCGDYSLKNKFGELFDICNEQSMSVADMASRGWRLTFRRWLDENAQNQLRHLRDAVLVCALGTQKDKLIWVWEKNKVYSVKSMYNHLCRADVGEPNQKIWKAKIPLKNKIFMWLIQQDAILTKNNLLKRNWHGDKFCCFCNLEENIPHLFFECSLAKCIWSLVAWVINADCRPTNESQYSEWCERFMPCNKNLYMIGLAAICWAIWRTRNSVCFDKKKIRSPTEILCLASSVLNYWAGLQQEEGRALLEAGAEALKEAALLHHPQEAQEPGAGTVLLQ